MTTTPSDRSPLPSTTHDPPRHRRRFRAAADTAPGFPAVEACDVFGAEQAGGDQRRGWMWTVPVGSSASEPVPGSFPFLGSSGGACRRAGPSFGSPAEGEALLVGGRENRP